MKRIAVILSFVLLFNGCVNQNSQIIKNSELTEALFRSYIEAEPINIAGLTQIIAAMPKGGDIHHHYSGSIYAETYLDWVNHEGWFIDTITLMICKTQKANCIDVDALKSNNLLYNKLLSYWSNKDYSNHFHLQVPPDQQFFNTFGYFGTISSKYMSEGLNVLKKRAINENIQYIETMLSKVGINANDYLSDPDTYNQRLKAAKSQSEVNIILNEIDSLFFGKEDFNNQVNAFVESVEKNHIGIDTINFKMRYQTYASRVTSPLQVYTDLLSGFKAASQSDLIVGVNIVAAENNLVALEDYTLHMQFFNYLGSRYPDVKRALHAGELALGMVEPKDMLFHINEAVHIARAQRIGHGVSLPYEKQSLELIQSLKRDSIAIEINLTSNEFILGVKGNEHPFLLYSAHGVPMVISTDDSGVSRNNLTREFVLLASRYNLSYSYIQKLVYNSIKYSFLNDEEKKQLEGILNSQFADFESKVALISR